MGKIKGLLNAFINWITQKNVRHNRELSDLLYLSKSVEDFCAKYHLLEETSFKSVFENMVQARTDATELACQTKIRIKRAESIEDKDLPLLIEEVYKELEELKRSLYTRSLSNKVLIQRASKLDIAFENLLGAISNIGYK